MVPQVLPLPAHLRRPRRDCLSKLRLVEMSARPQFTFSSPRTRICLTPKHILIWLKNGSIVSAKWAQETGQVLKGNLAHKLMVAKHYRVHDDFLLRNHAPPLLAYKLKHISKMVLPTVKSGPTVMDSDPRCF